MFKQCYCALAVLSGGLIGATAPTDWRPDAQRVAQTASLAERVTSPAIAMVYRPFQQDD